MIFVGFFYLNHFDYKREKKIVEQEKQRLEWHIFNRIFCVKINTQMVYYKVQIEFKMLIGNTSHLVSAHKAENYKVNH